MTSRISGMDAGSTTSEWYRVATNGFGRPSEDSLSVVAHFEVFPCMSTGAWTMLPPKACPMHWCPRQTPRIGISPDELLDDGKADS